MCEIEGDVSKTENRARLVVGGLEGGWRRRRARRGLREGGRQGGVERDVAFDLLHDLVNVAVEHRHRSEALEIAKRARGAFGPPAPRGLDGPERTVRAAADRR